MPRAPGPYPFPTSDPNLLRPLRCVEHQVLSDEAWRAHLDRAAAHATRRGRAPQFIAAVVRAHRQLGVHLETSKRKANPNPNPKPDPDPDPDPEPNPGPNTNPSPNQAQQSGRSRTGRDRRSRLETQMSRLAAWLAAVGDGVCAEGVGVDAGAARDGGAASTTTAAAADAFAPFFPLLGIWDEV